MNVVIHAPYEASYAYRTIDAGWARAFSVLGHTVRLWRAGQPMEEVLTPETDLFLTHCHWYYRRYINFKYLNFLRSHYKLKVIAKLDFWCQDSVIPNFVSYIPMSLDKTVLSLIEKNQFADIYHHVALASDPRMKGHDQVLPRPYVCIPLAADSILWLQEHSPDCNDLSSRYQNSIIYIGSNQSEKKSYIKTNWSSLAPNYQVRFLGQDWTAQDVISGYIERLGRTLNLKPLANIRRNRMPLIDEYYYYKFSQICFNVHLPEQRRYGTELNERTFKIGLVGGFQVCDNVSLAKEMFGTTNAMIIASTPREWHDAVDHFLHHPLDQASYRLRLQTLVWAEHTYIHRISKLLHAVTDSSIT